MPEPLNRSIVTHEMQQIATYTDELRKLGGDAINLATQIENFAGQVHPRRLHLVGSAALLLQQAGMTEHMSAGVSQSTLPRKHPNRDYALPFSQVVATFQPDSTVLEQLMGLPAEDLTKLAEAIAESNGLTLTQTIRLKAMAEFGTYPQISAQLRVPRERLTGTRKNIEKAIHKRPNGPQETADVITKFMVERTVTPLAKPHDIEQAEIVHTGMNKAAAEHLLRRIREYKRTFRQGTSGQTPSVNAPTEEGIQILEALIGSPQKGQRPRSYEEIVEIYNQRGTKVTVAWLREHVSATLKRLL